MKRVHTKIGDVFSVKIKEEKKKYFQLVAFDLTQLNSDVIRAFKSEYHLNEDPELSDIVKEDVDFYAHCVTKWGVQMGLWEKVGSEQDIGDIAKILFRGTRDYGHKAGDEPIRISDKWYIWHINDKNFTRVGRLEGENRKAEIGIVVNPNDIVDRMKTGKYKFFYPDFE